MPRTNENKTKKITKKADLDTIKRLNKDKMKQRNDQTDIRK